MNFIKNWTTLLFVFFAIQFNAQTGNVGVGTTSPNAKLHVNGDVRIDSIKATNDAVQVVVIDTVTQTLALRNINAMATVGDIKQGLQASDHSGWVKLDGRLINTLTSAQQTQAILFGFATNLPDATNAYLSQNEATLGSVSSDNTKTITRNQLPNVTLSGSTSTDGSHTHTSEDAYFSPTSTLGDSSGGGGQRGYPATTTKTTDADGEHTHTVVTESLNGGVTQQELDITPKTLSVNLFIYLGN